MKFTDDENGQQVSKRELARRRDARAAERQAEPVVSDGLMAFTNLLRHGSADGRKNVVCNFAVEPRPKPVKRAVAPALGFSAEEIPAAHRRGEIDFDDHGSRHPSTRYSVTRQRPAYWPKIF